MRLTLSPEITALLELIRRECEQGQDLFLVGGAIRDGCLGRAINDLDFAMDGDPPLLAKRVAKRLKVPFFLLDDERHTARILYKNPKGKPSPLDFVQFSGGGLDDDLQNRDFTINAMAVPIRHLSRIIDPLGGQADLENGLLRPCSVHALLDDPVRVLRGIRLALQFDLRFASDLPSKMQAAAQKLSETSFERQRDEFFKILEGPNPGEGMRCCRQFNVFDTLIPPITDQEGVRASPPHSLPLFDHTIAAVGYFAELLNCIKSGEVPEGSPWYLVQAVNELSPFSGKINAFFSEEVTPGRSKRGLALLGTLLHDVGKPYTMTAGEDDRLHYYGHAREGSDLAREAARRQQLSNTEAAWVQTLVRRHMDLLPLVNQKQPFSRQAIYRFFQQTRDAGVAIGLISLADTLATYGENLAQDTWQMALRITRGLFFAWWELQKAVVSPTLLLNGDDLQKEFGLEPGKQIGRLLDALKEAQAIGKVTNRSEAEAFIRSRVNQNKGG
jgi:tRNA nucleotidyltransferase/poly(A) polymerase